MSHSRWTSWCAILLLASCGGDSDADAATDAVPSTPDAPATRDETPRSVVSVGVSPCSLITVGEVSAATGHTVVGSDAQPPISCVFDLDDAGVDIFVAIEDGQGRLSGPAALFADYSARIGDGGVEAVSNVGEAAVFDAGFRTIVVDAGDGRFLAIGVNGGFETLGEPRDTLIELAAAAVDRLLAPDAGAQVGAAGAAPTPDRDPSV